MGSIRTSKMADVLGVTPQTVRKYAEQGKIPHHTSPSGQLLFTPEDVRKALGEAPEPDDRVWAHYARSSSGNADAIASQVEMLCQFYGEPAYVIKDKASGLNEHRKGLSRLIALAQSGEITDIAVTRQDRITRFGYRYLETLLSQNGVTVHSMDHSEPESMQEELMADFMSIIASFSGRYSQMRTRKAKKALLSRAMDRVDEAGDHP